MDRESRKRLIIIGSVIAGLYFLNILASQGSGGLVTVFSDVIILVCSALPAIILHEVAHGWVSYKLGDPLPKASGRLSLNPLKHLDPVGTLMVIVFRIGWAKPVLIDPRYYKNRKQGELLVSIAGPLANFCMALSAVLILEWFGISLKTFAGRYFLTFFQINVILGVFNLIPFPPLDGSKILYFFLPDRIRYQLYDLEKYGFIVLFMIIMISNYTVPGGFGQVLAIMSRPFISAIIFIARFLT